MRKLYITLTSIMLTVFLSISIVVSHSIYKQFEIRNNNIKQLNYIKLLNDKIDILNNIYELSSNINTINNNIDMLNKNIDESNKTIIDLNTSNEELKKIIEEYKNKSV